MSSLLAETFDSYDPDVNKGYTVDLGASTIGTISGLGPLLVQLSGINISGGMALSGKDSGLNIWQRLGLAAIADLSRNIKLDEHFKTIDYPFFLVEIIATFIVFSNFLNKIKIIMNSISMVILTMLFFSCSQGHYAIDATKHS